MTAFEFADETIDASVKSTKQAEPNPYTEIIQAIALKTDDKGQPVGKSFVVSKPANEADYARLLTKVRRQMSAAGDVSDPRVTVFVVPKPVPLMVAGKPTSKVDESRVKLAFWTVKRQVRTRKVQTDAEKVAEQTAELAREHNLPNPTA